jgi:DNA polymerase III delta subunit
VKPTDVRKRIAAGDTAPLYLLEGDDVQSRHDLAAEFAALVDEGLHAFNVQTFHANEATTTGGRDALIGEILSSARTLPMMAPRRVLTVYAAERLLSPRKSKDDDPDETPSREAPGKRKRGLSPTEDLERYLEEPEPLTTLVFVTGPLDNNRRLVKLVRKHATVVDCGSLDSAADAARWIKARLEQEKLGIEDRAIGLILETTGLSLGRVRAEVDKLALYAMGEPVVTVRHVRELIVPETEPGEDFALGRAIWNGNARDALREIQAQFDNGAQAPMVLGQIRAAAGRLKPDDKAKSGLDAVFEADQAIKSSMGEPKFVLECLVIQLCAR